MTAAAALAGYMLLVAVVAGCMLGHTQTAILAAATALRDHNWLPLGGNRCPHCGRKNPGKNHDCQDAAPAPALRVPSWAKADA